MPVILSNAGNAGDSASVFWQNNKVSQVRSSNSVSTNPAINMTDPATWSSWRPSGSNGWAYYDFGAPVSIDSVGIAAHNLATSPSSISISWSTNTLSWNTNYTYSPTTNDDIIILMQQSTARYWRISINGSPANIGVVVFGKRLQFPHAPMDEYKPLHHARTYTKEFNDSIKGHFLGNRVTASGAETTVDMGFFERSWMEANIRPFERHYNQGGTFFYCGCPNQSPLDMGYCRANGVEETLDISWIEADKLASLSFGVKSYVG